MRRLSAANSLWTDRAFVLFLTGRAVSLLGSVITFVALPLLVYGLTGSALQTSLLTSLGVLPYLLFGLFAGAVADRIDRRKLMVGCDLVNAALLASIPLAHTLDMLTLPQVYLVEFLSATAFVWFDAANFGALPAIAGRDRLIAANSAVWTTGTLIGIIGPALGGLLAASLGAPWAISLDALSYAISALILALIPRAFSSSAKEQPATRDHPAPLSWWTSTTQHLPGDIREGLRFIWQQRLVRAMTLLGVSVSFTGGALTGLLVVYAIRALELPEQDSRIGVLFTTGALGSLAASLLLPRINKRFQAGTITLVGLMLNPLFMAGVALAPSFVVGAVLYLCWNAIYTLIIINGISLRQMVTPDHLQSRVNATARMIAWGGAPFGAAVGGVLAELTTIRATYLVMAVVVAISALIGWFSPLRARKGAHPGPLESRST